MTKITALDKHFVCVCEVWTQNYIVLGIVVNIGSYSVYCLLLVAREVFFHICTCTSYMEGFCIEIKHAIIVYIILPLLI